MPWARAAARCGGLPGPAIDRDDQPAAGPCGPAPQPGTGDQVEEIAADQGERAPVRGLLRRAPVRVERGQHVRAGIGGPLPDRAERPSPRDHRRDPDGQHPGQRMPTASAFARVRDPGQEIESGQEIEKVPDAGSPPAYTPGTSSPITSPQVTALHHDSAVSLVRRSGRRPPRGSSGELVGVAEHAVQESHVIGDEEPTVQGGLPRVIRPTPWGGARRRRPSPRLRTRHPMDVRQQR